jgi:hypothetical protein
MPFLATLHALRDLLPQDEVVPTLLRGLHYDASHPSVWTVSRSRSAFIKCVQDDVECIQDGVHRDTVSMPRRSPRAVLALLAARLPAGELDDPKATTPRPLHSLWPN